MNIETLIRGTVLRDQLGAEKQVLAEISSEIEESRVYIETQEKGVDKSNRSFGIEGEGGKVYLKYKTFGRTFLTCLAVLKADIQQEVDRLEKEFAELKSE